MAPDKASNLKADNITESEYWHDYQLILDEVNTAIESFYTYLEIHRFASEDRDVYNAINGNPTFWNIQLYSLQTVFFITLGRLFDESGSAHSIHKLINSTIKHQEYFSKDALARRKTIGEKTPDWLDEYLVDVFEPTPSDLRTLKIALRPHTNKFKSVYRDIRHKVFAHREIKDKKDISDLFNKTQIKEIDEILYFLYDLLQELWQLFYNGRRPQLGANVYDYRDRIKNTTRAVLLKISK